MPEIKYKDIEDPIIEYNGKMIFQSDLDLLIAKYIELLPNKEYIYKSNGFSGLLEYIYKNKLKAFYNRYSKQSIIDIQCLDLVFMNIYIPLCRIYNITPKLNTFCVCLANVTPETIRDIKNNTNTNGTERIRQIDVFTVKKWYAICEAGLTEKAIEESSIGAIFGLKSIYGYRDNTTLTIENGSIQPHETAEQIAARHKTAQLPQKPDL